MREDQWDQAERRETLKNDLKVLRERGGTYHQHGVAQAGELSGGRFAATGVPTVTGTTPVPNYPAAGAHQGDPVGTEPPLGYSVAICPGLRTRLVSLRYLHQSQLATRLMLHRVAVVQLLLVT
jgi:hypothetical protein